MSRALKSIEIARQLGISPRTMSELCRKDPALAFKRKGDWYVRIEELAKRPGFDLVQALMLTSARWIKSTDLARLTGWSRRTVVRWCATRRNYAKRIGRTWYVDLSQVDAPEEKIEAWLRQSEQRGAPGSSERFSLT